MTFKTDPSDHIYLFGLISTEIIKQNFEISNFLIQIINDDVNGFNTWCYRKLPVFFTI